MEDFDFEAAYKELKKELQWIHDLMRNEKIQSDEKVVLYEAKYELSHSKMDEKGIARLYVWKVADETGISTDKVGKSLKLLSDHGVLERRVEHTISDRGQMEKALFVGLTDVARNPKQISLPATKRGGKRTKRFCPSCGNPEHIEHRKCICTSCGTVFDETWKTVDDRTEEEPTDV